MELAPTLEKALDYAIKHGRQYDLPENKLEIGADSLGYPISQKRQSTVHEVVYNLGDKNLTIRVTDSLYQNSVGDEKSRYESWMRDRLIEIILGQDLIINGRKILGGEDIRIEPTATTKEPKKIQIG